MVAAGRFVDLAVIKLDWFKVHVIKGRQILEIMDLEVLEAGEILQARAAAAGTAATAAAAAAAAASGGGSLSDS